VLGLVILGAVSGVIAAAAQGVPFSVLSIARIAAAAMIFLVGALLVGIYCRAATVFGGVTAAGRGVLVTLSLSFCFVMAYTSSLIGLAPIVGAFAAGLVLEDVHFKDFVSRGERSLEELIRPISDALVPIFFVLMGLRTDLSALISGGSWNWLPPSS
jgi:Kef-type K+ transport system membrane component KefB